MFLFKMSSISQPQFSVLSASSFSSSPRVRCFPDSGKHLRHSERLALLLLWYFVRSCDTAPSVHSSLGLGHTLLAVSLGTIVLDYAAEQGVGGGVRGVGIQVDVAVVDVEYAGDCIWDCSEDFGRCWASGRWSSGFASKPAPHQSGIRVYFVLKR